MIRLLVRLVLVLVLIAALLIGMTGGALPLILWTSQGCGAYSLNPGRRALRKAASAVL